MQTDEEVGKVAAAVPVIISRALELFVESLLTKAVQITSARNAKTLSPAHLKQCILAESRFDFLKDLVLSIPDVQGDGEDGGSSVPATPVSHNPPVFRSQSVNSEEPSSSRGGRRPRGRPRKNPLVVQRSWSTKSGKSATESEESDEESDGSDEDDELSTDTDSLPKGSKSAVANKNGDGRVANPQATIQFNAVQPNFYQEITNTSAPFQIQINIPPHDPLVGNGQSNKESVEDDDYDT